MQHVKLLADFFKGLNLDETRVERPDPFIFFCGGVVEKKSKSKFFYSLRDYIYRRPIKLEHRIVLAEDAVKLFQESQYDNLITFEEHIAQISELVVLICESPGSLAELGAFCLNPQIADRLFVIIPEKHSEADSFVRLGPLRALEKENSDAVGAFPWEEIVSSKEKTTISIEAQYDRVMVEAIKSNLRKSKSEALKTSSDAHRMILLYWACFMLRAATKKELAEFFTQIGMGTTAADIDRYMYCMIVARWITTRNLGKRYYIPHHDRDPFRYAYQAVDPANAGRADSLKTTIAEIVKSQNLRPPQITEMIGAGDPAEVLS